jgi:hypothetical protein
VRGTVARIQVFFENWYQEGSATLVTNFEGNVYTVWQGEELPVPVGQTLILMEGQSPNFKPVANDDTAVTDEHTPVTIPVLDNDYDLDEGDTLTLDSVTQGANGVVEIIDDYNVAYSPDQGFNGIDSFNYTVSDGRGGTDTANVRVTVYETSAQIDVTIDEGPEALIFIYDYTLGEYAIDKDTGDPVDGEHHETGGEQGPITVAGGRDYYVWVDNGDYFYQVSSCPESWEKRDPIKEEYDDETAYGYLAADSLISVSFYA